MKVQVTQDDIDGGVCDSPSDCPIALALKRTTGHSDCTVDTDEIHIDGVRYKMPDLVCNFVAKYDNDDNYAEVEILAVVRPFEFELEDPDQ